MSGLIILLIIVSVVWYYYEKPMTYNCKLCIKKIKKSKVHRVRHDSLNMDFCPSCYSIFIKNYNDVLQEESLKKKVTNKLVSKDIQKHNIDGYLINSSKLYCSCFDMQNKRMRFDKNSHHRMCKHLWKYIHCEKPSIDKELIVLANYFGGKYSRSMPLTTYSVKFEINSFKGCIYIPKNLSNKYIATASTKSQWIYVTYDQQLFPYNLREAEFAKYAFFNCDNTHLEAVKDIINESIPAIAEYDYSNQVSIKHCKIITLQNKLKFQSLGYLKIYNDTCYCEAHFTLKKAIKIYFILRFENSGIIIKGKYCTERSCFEDVVVNSEAINSLRYIEPWLNGVFNEYTEWKKHNAIPTKETDLTNALSQYRTKEA